MLKQPCSYGFLNPNFKLIFPDFKVHRIKFRDRNSSYSYGKSSINQILNLLSLNKSQINNHGHMRYLIVTLCHLMYPNNQITTLISSITRKHLELWRHIERSPQITVLPHLLCSADLPHVLATMDEDWINSVFVMEAL